MGGCLPPLLPCLCQPLEKVSQHTFQPAVLTCQRHECSSEWPSLELEPRYRLHWRPTECMFLHVFVLVLEHGHQIQYVLVVIGRASARQVGASCWVIVVGQLLVEVEVQVGLISAGVGSWSSLFMWLLLKVWSMLSLNLDRWQLSIWSLLDYSQTRRCLCLSVIDVQGGVRVCGERRDEV